MSTLAAILRFPVRPADSALRLGRTPAAALCALLPPLLLLAWLRSRGCAPGDAMAAAIALQMIVLGLGTGGALGCQPASVLVAEKRHPMAAVAPCFVFAAWSVLIFPALGLLLAALGAGGAAVLISGLVLLLWGVAVGARVVAPEGTTEGGRAMVASCLGLTGAIAGLWLSLWFVSTSLVLLLPSPVNESPITRGDPLLVRITAEAGPGDLVFLREKSSGEVAIARISGDGRAASIGADGAREFPSFKWDIFGRVCFRFGGPGGGDGAIAQHASS